MQTLDNTFIISDQHQNHKNIIKYANRPFASVDAMNEALFNSIHALPDGCYLYDLGDFSFGNIETVKKSWETYIDIIGNKNIDLVAFGGNHSHTLKKLFDREGNNNYDYFYYLEEYSEISVEGHNFVLSHYPMESWNGMEKGSYMLAGHVHRNLLTDWNTRRFICCVENINYKPISLRDIMNKVEKRNKDTGWRLRLAKQLKEHHISDAEKIIRNDVLSEMFSEVFNYNPVAEQDII